ncbi:MAG: epoxyqueuosine reductase QueH [Oscillospiraceae bacterium]|nr:epoxyqueuosine reductase QueH [Oscillospiraceae bacterium]
MQNRRNYQRELEAVIAGLNGRRPTLLLHSCCAPCSSYVLEYLTRYFQITLFYYNPNISPEPEYRYRVSELRRLVAEMLPSSDVTVVEGRYDPERFEAAVAGLEEEPEGGRRCMVCYRLRLEEAAKMARELGCDYFTTTLTISPMKNAQALNQIGEQLAPLYETAYLPSDFKKKEGYKRSIQLSREFALYRQDYCGCVYSRRAREGQAESATPGPRT